MILYELSRGLAYRSIQHAEMHWYRTTLPMILTISSTLALISLRYPPTLLGSNGLLASSMAVASTLPGFFLAGLAAVATFNGLNMDAVMPAPAPKLKIKTGGSWSEIELSRRQFLSYLFSYLVLLSFALCAGLLLAAVLTPTIMTLKGEVLRWQAGSMWWALFRAVGIGGILATCSSILITTLHGMFFLTERIHQP